MWMDVVRFAGEIRYWKPERAGGLAVVDVPIESAFDLLKSLKSRARPSARSPCISRVPLDPVYWTLMPTPAATLATMSGP